MERAGRLPRTPVRGPPAAHGGRAPAPRRAGGGPCERRGRAAPDLVLESHRLLPAGWYGVAAPLVPTRLRPYWSSLLQSVPGVPGPVRRRQPTVTSQVSTA
ncbi:hypothetical protein [Streptomyces caelestis]|uniref:hypothetical protein n=1 Tax=Streptomyces caelestis TaxID=36816 RepID=UPI00365E5C6B